MTVLTEGSDCVRTSRQNVFAAVAVREIKGVARTLKFALRTLAWSTRCCLGVWRTPLDKSHVAKLDLTDKHSIKDRRDERSERCFLCLESMCSTFRSVSERVDSRNAGAMCLGVADRTSDFTVEQLLVSSEHVVCDDDLWITHNRWRNCTEYFFPTTTTAGDIPVTSGTSAGEMGEISDLDT